VAVRKTSRKNNKKGNPQGLQAVVVFFLLFFIVIACIFMFKWGEIKPNFNLFITRLTSPYGIEEELLNEEDETPAEPIVRESTPAAPERQTVPPAAVSPEPPKPQTTEPLSERPAAQPPERPQTQTQPFQAQPQTPPPVQFRDRAIYFTQVDKDGQILHSRVTRRIPVSDSPMQDALNVLLAGPSADEINRGILNLIPANTRILSTAVRGSTAYISFSEDFLFNTFGVEGYVAQLRQIVWTVTEFQNVRDVQILVEGRRLDYLGEGIWIGSPISRQSF
jgi:spore germination protein GerM